MLTVGQKLWYVDAGDRRGQEVTVTKVGRKWANLAPVWYGRVDVSTLASDGRKYTSGQCFVSRDEYISAVETRKVWLSFRKALRYGDAPIVSAAEIRKAATILGLKLDIDR